MDFEARPVIKPKETGKRLAELAIDVRDKHEAQSEHRIEKPRNERIRSRKMVLRTLDNPRTIRMQPQR